MKSVNLIYYNNGVGLSRDVSIIEDVLKDSFKINKIDITEGNCLKADINIFIQNLDKNNIEFLCLADYNILIPNIEWMHKFSIENIHLVDLIFAKSDECFNLLKTIHNNVFKTGFASVDRYVPSITKKPTFFHHCGKSIQKNTELVIDLFNENEIPITILDLTNRFSKKVKSNINYLTQFVNEDELNYLYNSNLYHICCSVNEGWGHQIYESISCESIVITTNSPPMNENLTNKECFLIDCVPDNVKLINDDYLNNNFHYPFRVPNYVDLKKLNECIHHIYKKDFLSLRKLARNKYKTICINFINTFKQQMLSL